MPVGERREQQRREDAPHVFQRERRSGVDVDPAASRPDRTDEIAEHAGGVGVDRAPRVVDPRRDPEVGEVGRPARWQVEAPSGSVPAVRAGEHPQFQLEVVDGSRHRAAHGDVGNAQRTWRARNLPVVGHDRVTRLVTRDAAVVRRHPDRSADVAAELDRGEPHRQCGRRPARRPARRARGVVGVVRRSVDLVERLDVTGVQRQVRLGERDRPGIAQPGDRPRVGDGHVRGEGRRAARRDASGGLERVLDRHRHAVQRAEIVAGQHGVVRRSSGRTGPVEVPLDDRVRRSVERFDPRREMIEHLDARHVAPTDRRREIRRRHPVQFVAHGTPTVSPWGDHARVRGDWSSPMAPMARHARDGGDGRPTAARPVR